MDYETIKIKKLSSPVLRKLQKGMRVKVSKGDDMAIAISPSKIKHVQKAFSRNKGALVSLTPTEIDTNMKIVGKGMNIFEKIGRKAMEYTTNPARISTDLGIAIAEPIGKSRGVPKAQRRESHRKTREIAKKYVEPAGNALLAPELMALKGLLGPELNALTGQGLYASPQGNGLYAQPHKKMEGRGKRILDQKFSAREAGHFLTKELPRAFSGKAIEGRGKRILDQPFSVREAGHFLTKELPRSFSGGALQRHTQHAHASDIGVGGDLLSHFEQHPAMRSQPFHTHFAGSRTLPIPFQKYHNTSI